ncbi:MAG: cellulase family glycosylhydrolase [Pseudomonadota bacterium]|nr:cellulase family glycosylhydrolase [Pseudomonadota bacterium]
MGKARMPRLRIQGRHFVDESGRIVLLRGVNLGGDCKVPYPDGGTHISTDFSDHRQVSFVGRPLPLAEADEHFGRLRHWGFNCLRLLTTWEAVEHAGPGQYDSEYLDYYARLCELAGEYGFYVYVDFHQDVWSRMTGGDGAPGWVFEKVGIDYTRLGDADAAFVMQYEYDYQDPRPRQNDNYPQMSWASNYGLAANGILWTLFFGGRDFAPQFTIDGKNVQDYLQGHFFGAQAAVAERVAHMPHVMGFDVLNEPSAGWIGRPMSVRHTEVTEEDRRPVLPGVAWSPFDGLRSARGMRLELPHMAISVLRRGMVQKGTRVVNSGRVSIWMDAGTDPFELAGAYRMTQSGSAEVLREDFFQRVDGRAVDFAEDYLAPFYQRAAENLRRFNPDWLIFAEPDLLNFDPERAFPRGLPDNTVNAGHCYDVTTLILKRHLYPIGFNLKNGRLLVGRGAMLADYQAELADVMRSSESVHGGCPTLIGEFGIPYDMRGGKAYRAYAEGDRSSGPWREHIRALEIMYEALDASLLSATQWNYTASNRNDLAIGDGWNQEDLSIFSRDQQHDPANIDSGGRALDGFVRPYASRIQGRPLAMSFSRKKGLFTLEFDADAAIAQPTELFLPQRQFPKGYVVTAPGLEQVEAGDQWIRLLAKTSGRMHVTVKRR